MSLAPYKTDYGIYPAVPGFTVSIGDYGEWKGNVWCHLGNIYDDFGPIYFNRKKENVDRIEICDIGVKLSGGLNVDAKSTDADAKLEIDFGAVGGLHYRAHIVKVERFASVQNEVYAFMKKYLEASKWEPRFWLAVEVCYADNLLSIQSKAKNAKMEISGDMDDELELARADFSAHFKYDQATVNILNFSDKVQFAGARFVSFTRTGIFRKKLIASYQGESLDYESASEQTVY